MFQHFGQRLKRDLKLIVDRRLEASAAASGSAQRSSGVEVDVISHKRQRWVPLIPPCHPRSDFALVMLCGLEARCSLPW
jgi:hypothetical protein